MRPMTIATSLLLSCWIAVPLAQQKTAPAEPPAHNVYVLSGCLEGGAAASGFKLTRATAVGQAPPASSSSGPGAREAKADDQVVYDVQPTASISESGVSREKLQNEVGARVEVTVRPVEVMPAPARPTSTSPAVTPTAPTTAAVKPEEQPRPRYTVVKVTRLANSCG